MERALAHPGHVGNQGLNLVKIPHAHALRSDRYVLVLQIPLLNQHTKVAACSVFQSTRAWLVGVRSPASLLARARLRMARLCGCMLWWLVHALTQARFQGIFDWLHVLLARRCNDPKIHILKISTKFFLFKNLCIVKWHVWNLNPSFALGATQLGYIINRAWCIVTCVFETPMK